MALYIRYQPIVLGGGGGGGGVTSIDPFGSSPNNAGGTVVGQVLTLEPADATHPGGVSTTTQTFAGQKTFATGLTGTLTGHATLDVATSSLGDLSDAGTDGIVVTGGTGAVVGSVSLAQHVADTLHNGYLSSADWNTFSGKQDAVSFGAFGSTPNADGGSISASVITLQPADATHPGGITTGSQTIAGSKTLSGLLNADGGIDRSTSGTLTIGATNSTTINIGNSGATVNIQGTTIYENTPQLLTADPLITVNHGGAAGSGQNAGIQVEEDAIITGYNETSSDRASWILKAPSTAGVVTITPGSSGFVIDQASHDPVTLGAFGSSPNADGASLSSQVLTLQPADGTHPGGLSTTTQTIAGQKTFSTGITGTLTGTASGNLTLASPVSHGILLSGSANATTALAVPASGTLLTGVASSDPAFSATPTLGVAGTTAGTLGLSGVTLGVVTQGAADSTTSYSIKWPSAQASGTKVLQNDGSGNLSWVTGGGSVTSVDFSVPATSILSVSGNPITTSGTIALATTGTSGGIPYFSSTSQLTSSALLANHGVILGAGAGAAPKTLAVDSSTTKVLTSGGSSADPSWAAVSGTSFATQSANVVFAGPTSSTATPTFRSLVTADLPGPIAARYTSAAGQSITANTITIIDFGTQTYDTNSAVTTGASWKFTAPAAGYYLVMSSSSFTYDPGSDATSNLFIYKNNAAIKQQNTAIVSAGGSNIFGNAISDIVSLAANDTVDIRVSINTTQSLDADATKITVSISSLH